MNYDMLEDFLEYKRNIISLYKKYLTDKNIDLNERWDLFSKLSFNKLLPIQTTTNLYLDLLSPNINYFIEKNEFWYYSDLLTSILDVSESEIGQSNIKTWMEFILDNGYGGFKYNWGCEMTEDEEFIFNQWFDEKFKNIDNISIKFVTREIAKEAWFSAIKYYNDQKNK